MASSVTTLLLLLLLAAPARPHNPPQDRGPPLLRRHHHNLHLDLAQEREHLKSMIKAAAVKYNTAGWQSRLSLGLDEVFDRYKTGGIHKL